jgi:hypothetical protein
MLLQYKGVDMQHIFIIIFLFYSYSAFAREGYILKFAPLPTKKVEKNIGEFLLAGAKEDIA